MHCIFREEKLAVVLRQMVVVVVMIIMLVAVVVVVLMPEGREVKTMNLQLLVAKVGFLVEVDMIFCKMPISYLWAVVVVLDMETITLALMEETAEVL